MKRGLRALAAEALKALQKESAPFSVGAFPSPGARMTGADLRRIRVETFGWRQVDMAEALGVSFRTYQRREQQATVEAPQLWMLAVLGLVALMRREALPDVLTWIDKAS